MAVPLGRLRLDVGRLIMVPAFAGAIAADVMSLDHGSHSGAAGVLRSVGTVLAVAFYVLAISCYLRRRPAIATSSSVTAHAAAVTSTWLPFALPLLPGSPPGPDRQALADALLTCGMAWAVWSLRYLDRNVSVLAQARDVVDQGPYRWVRHPLYSGEMVSSLGLAIAVNSYWALALWVAMCGLQVYRAVQEEQVLLRALPAYRDYRNRTAALLPGVF
ncbi:MAG TPA: isoprenylcysteine carboxylmethyltransferase family protein [Streptosporangiaceae bacterium]|nr:isoprenylcysteine carboxylmethyltransferase family protein [Streptosporangiaceae bacterium]